MNGGYLIISKNQADAYALSVKALELGKPVLFYEDDTTCYYIDTITKSGTDIILTKGGKTITIESDGTITEVGDIQNHLYIYSISISTDYSFNILLPFKLENRTFNDSSINDEDKIYLQKIYDYFNNDVYESGYSLDSSKDVQVGHIIKSSSYFNFIMYLVNYQSSDDSTLTYTLNVVNDKIDSLNTATDEMNIKFIQQLF